MNDDAWVKCTAVICLTILGCTYFITIRHDGSVLLTLSSIIGGLIGYQIGKKKS